MCSCIKRSKEVWQQNRCSIHISSLIRILKSVSEEHTHHIGFILTNETSRSLQQEKMNSAPYVIIPNACWDIDLLQAKCNTRWIMAFWWIHFLCQTYKKKSTTGAEPCSYAASSVVAVLHAICIHHMLLCYYLTFCNFIKIFGILWLCFYQLENTNKMLFFPFFSGLVL